MRLYKNVKIKLRGNLTCTVSTKATFKDRNKCYEELDLCNKRLSYPLMGTFQRCCESEDVKLLNIQVNLKPDAKVTWVSESEAKFDLIYKGTFALGVYGRIFIGQSSEFEECFETRSGKKLSEIMPTEEQIKTEFAEDYRIKNYDVNACLSNVSYNLENDVELIINDEAFNEVLNAHRDIIMEEVEDRISDRLSNYDY